MMGFFHCSCKLLTLFFTYNSLIFFFFKYKKLIHLLMEIHFKFWEFQSSFWRIHDSIRFFSGLNEVASFFFT